jgi:hypothetical protein
VRKRMIAISKKTSHEKRWQYLKIDQRVGESVHWSLGLFSWD